MGLTQISTGGVKDDAVTAGKIPANAIGSSEIADDAVDQGAIADEAVDEARLQISNAGSNGQFLQKQSGNTGGLTWAAANQYTHPNHSGEVTSTADGAQVIADNVVDEANLKVSNSPTNGQLLSAQSGNTGGLTWTDPPASSPQFEATASGAITAGKPVIINSNGTVTQVAESYTALSQPTLYAHQKIGSGNTGEWNASVSAYDPTNNRVVLFYKQNNGSPSDRQWIFMGTPTDGGITWGDKVQPSGNPTGNAYSIVWDSNVSKFILFGSDSTGAYVRTLTLTGTSSSDVTWGTRTGIVDNNTGAGDMTFDTSANKAIIVFRDNSAGYRLKTRTVTAPSDNGACTLGTSVDVTTYNGLYSKIVYGSTPNKSVVVYKGNASGNDQLKSRVITVSGTSISLGSETNVETAASEALDIIYEPNASRFVFTYLKSDSGDKWGVRVASVSGTSASWGSFDQFWDENSGIYNKEMSVYDPVMKQVVIINRHHTGSKGGRFWYGKVSTTSNAFSPTLSNATDYYYGNNTNPTTQTSHEVMPHTCFYDTTHNQVHIIYANFDDSENGYYQTLKFHETTTNLTSSNYIGLAAATVADTATATIDVTGATNTGVSGLTVGSNYYVQGSGALSTSGNTFAGKAVAANKLIVDYLKPDIGAWEVVSTHVLTGSTSDIGWTGWSSDYAQYKVVFSGCYNSDQNLMRIRFYTDSTSGNTGSLVTSSAYKRTGLKTTYGSTTYTVDAGTSSYFYPQVASFGTETNNGELIFPMKTSGHTGPHQCYGEWLGHADHWSNLTCELDANTTHILTGIHIYFTANNSLTAKAPTSGRVTLLRMKV